MDINIVIGGCRNYNDYDYFFNSVHYYLSSVCSKYDIVIISGGCRGTDKLAQRYAFEKGYKFEECVAEWGKYGRSAGPIRNRKMVTKADCVIAFWDGKSKGTGNLIDFAKEFNKPIRIVMIGNYS